MPKPQPGKQYVIQDEDTLSQVSLRAYGDAQYWPRIWEANQSRLRSGDPHLIFPGEVIVIPVLTERDSLIDSNQLTGKEPDELTIVLDGLEIPVVSARIFRAMDTVADGWRAIIAWNPGENIDLDRRTLPYAYTLASVFIGGQLIIKGVQYLTDRETGTDGTIQNLAGASFTADLVDSTLRPPYERNNITLKQRATELVKPLGIGVQFEADPGGIFSRITATENDTIFSHLAKLALQRGGLFTSTTDGKLLFTESTTEGPVGTLEEGQPRVSAFRAAFDGRRLFNVYRVVGQSPAGPKSAIAKDNNVPRSRFRTFRADDTSSGDIQKAADWIRSKQLADALTIPFPVEGWLDPQGNIWRENTKVTIISQTMSLPQGFDFLIRSVEFNYTADGQTATLNLVPPQVYTKEEIILPWR